MHKNRDFNRNLNLLEVKPILPAQKNKAKIFADDMLRRRKDERLIKKAARTLGLRIKIDNVDGCLHFDMSLQS